MGSIEAVIIATRALLAQESARAAKDDFKKRKAADRKLFESDAFGKKPRRKADDGMTEKTLAYLATQHDVWAERRNSGYIIQLTPGGGRYKIWLGEDGTPDVCGKIRTTTEIRGFSSEYHMRAVLIPFGIETKCKGGKLNPKQRKFHEKAARWGMPVCTAETLDDVKLFLEGLRR